MISEPGCSTAGDRTLEPLLTDPAGRAERHPDNRCCTKTWTSRWHGRRNPQRPPAVEWFVFQHSCRLRPKINHFAIITVEVHHRTNFDFYLFTSKRCSFQSAEKSNSVQLMFEFFITPKFSLKDSSNEFKNHIELKLNWRDATTDVWDNIGIYQHRNHHAILKLVKWYDVHNLSKFIAVALTGCFLKSSELLTFGLIDRE